MVIPVLPLKKMVFPLFLIHMAQIRYRDSRRFVAATVASILRGKHLPTFTPNVDCGDHVIVINADKIILTGNKLNQKVRYYHTGWVGGIKEIHYNKLMAEEPEKAVMYAVNGMLPNNTIGRKALTRLRVYKGTEHDHQAQNPIAWTGEIK